MVRLYGSEARTVMKLDASPLVPRSNFFKGEIQWAVEVEAAFHLEDLIYRRLRMAWFEPAEVESVLPEAAEAMAVLLAWDKDRIAKELDQTRARLRSDLAFKDND